MIEVIAISILLLIGIFVIMTIDLTLSRFRIGLLPDRIHFTA
jgi:hypothetical protein